MNSNQRLRLLKEEHGLTIDRIRELTIARRSIVYAWLAGDRNMPDAKLELLEMKLEKMMYKIYAQPKNGADGLPHYRDEAYSTKSDAQTAINEQLEDGVGKYWNLSVREI